MKVKRQLTCTILHLNLNINTYVPSFIRSLLGTDFFLLLFIIIYSYVTCRLESQGINIDSFSVWTASFDLLKAIYLHVLTRHEAIVYLPKCSPTRVCIVGSPFHRSQIDILMNHHVNKSQMELKKDPHPTISLSYQFRILIGLCLGRHDPCLNESHPDMPPSLLILVLMDPHCDRSPSQKIPSLQILTIYIGVSRLRTLIKLSYLFSSSCRQAGPKYSTSSITRDFSTPEPSQRPGMYTKYKAIPQAFDILQQLSLFTDRHPFYARSVWGNRSITTFPKIEEMSGATSPIQRLT